MTMLDLAKSLAPHLGVKIIGIRPGEKLHEIMIPRDDSHHTLEFADHYVIQPSIQFTQANDFTCNAIGEIGKPVEIGFEYSSETNSQWLDAKGLLGMINA